MNISFTENADDTITVCLLIDEDYPPTEFAEYCRVEHDGCFGQLSMEIIFYNDYRSDSSRRIYNQFEPFIRVKGANLIYIRELYMFNSPYNVYSEGALLATDTENKMLRGAGRRILCASLLYLVNKYKLDRKKTYVALIAARPRDLSAAKQISRTRLAEFSVEEMTALWSKLAPDDYAFNSTRFRSRDDIALHLSYIYLNNALVEYYSRTYGLKFCQRDKAGTGVKLCSELSTVWSACDYTE